MPADTVDDDDDHMMQREVSDYPQYTEVFVEAAKYQGTIAKVKAFRVWQNLTKPKALPERARVKEPGPKYW